MASSTSTVSWLSVMVKHSQTVVKERTILKCSWHDSFGFLLLKFGCDDLEAETIHEVIISNNDKFIDPRHKVPIDAPVSVCDQFGCMYICLYLTEKETTRFAPARTISDVLMGYSLELVLPDPAKPLQEDRALRADLRLCNDVLG